MESGLHPAAAGQRPDVGRIQFRSSGGRPDLLPVLTAVPDLWHYSLSGCPAKPYF